MKLIAMLALLVGPLVSAFLLTTAAEANGASKKRAPYISSQVQTREVRSVRVVRERPPDIDLDLDVVRLIVDLEKPRLLLGVGHLERRK